MAAPFFLSMNDTRYLSCTFMLEDGETIDLKEISDKIFKLLGTQLAKANRDSFLKELSYILLMKVHVCQKNNNFGAR